MSTVVGGSHVYHVVGRAGRTFTWRSDHRGKMAAAVTDVFTVLGREPRETCTVRGPRIYIARRQLLQHVSAAARMQFCAPETRCQLFSAKECQNDTTVWPSSATAYNNPTMTVFTARPCLCGYAGNEKPVLVQIFKYLWCRRLFKEINCRGPGVCGSVGGAPSVTGWMVGVNP